MVLDKLRRWVNWVHPSLKKHLARTYATKYEQAAIDPNLVVYETRDGQNIVDSPLAMFEYLTQTPEYAHFKHIWVVDGAEDQTEIKQSIPAALRDCATFVQRDTDAYVEALLTAKYVINNSTYQYFVSKRPGQIFIDTWHGTPLKHMGFDGNFPADDAKNVLRSLLMTDYLFSPNRHTTDIFRRGYKLDGIFPGTIVEGGYPRIDQTLNTPREDVINELIVQGLNVDPKKQTILYTPTWRGQNVHQATDDIEQIVHETQELVARFGDTYNVLVKVHPYAFDGIRHDARVQKQLVSNYADPNVLLAAVDVLVTDYSSIFFDFIVTNKPIIFYAWDKDLYDAQRGMYFDQAELPGPTAETMNELCDLIAALPASCAPYRPQYEAMKAKIVPYDDGQVTKRYVDYIFGQHEGTGLTLIKPNSNKIKLLIYPGAMKKNGITTSFLNLTANIDYSRYDVTMITSTPRSYQARATISRLDSHVRSMFRFGYPLFSARDELLNHRLMAHGIPKNKRSKFPLKMYQREMDRLTGGLTFDVAIDFSGYSYFWSRHIIGARAKRHYVFMHNDMDANAHRVVDGKMPMLESLRNEFSTYYLYDRIFSVSPMTRDVNLSKLGDYVTPEQMHNVVNTINIEHLLHPTNREADATQSLSIERAKLMVSKEITVPVATNLENLRTNLTTSLSLNPNQLITQYATYQWGGRQYAKVAVDSDYRGWIPTDKLTDAPIRVLEERRTFGIGTMKTRPVVPVWAKPEQQPLLNKMRATSDYLARHYVRIDRCLMTNQGEFYQVRLAHNDRGVVASDVVVRIHFMAWCSPLRIYFSFREWLLQRAQPVRLPKQIMPINEYYVEASKLTDDMIWTQPPQTTGAQPLNQLSNFAGTVFLGKRDVVVGDVHFVELTLNGEVVGYTNQKNLVAAPAPANESAESSAPAAVPEVDLTGRPLPEFDPGAYNVVNMGRLSVEKNQANLITAFEQFHRKHPHSRLYILGDGMLADELIAQVKGLADPDMVYLLGHVDGPYAFMRKCQLFVLPSTFEGQPMVLLEAMTLKMTILASNIPANIQVVGADERYGQLTKGTDVAAIASGLSRVFETGQPASDFDPYAYNQAAIESFYTEIAGSEDRS